MKNNTDKTASVNGIEISYKILGEENNGTPLLMIMGLGCTKDMWPEIIIQKLSEKYKLIIFDNRGMGYSTASDEEFSIELFAEDAIALMKHLNIEKVNIFSWSMGTMIAQEMALKAPSMLDKIILYSTYCGGENSVYPAEEVWKSMQDMSGTIEERAMRMFNNIFPKEWMSSNPTFYKCFPEINEPVNDSAIVRQSNAINNWPGVCEKLSEISSETLLVFGNEDIAIPPQNGILMAKKIPLASLVFIKGGGHGAMYQYPEKFVEYIDAFLQVNK